MRKSTLADQFMQLKAEKSALEKKEEELKAKLLALGDDRIEGKQCAVNIICQPGRTTVDVELLTKLNPTLASQVLKTGKSFNRFDVRAL